MIIQTVHAAARGKNKLFYFFLLCKVKQVLQSNYIHLLIGHRVLDAWPDTGLGGKVNNCIGWFCYSFCEFAGRSSSKINVQKMKIGIAFEVPDIKLFYIRGVKWIEIINTGDPNSRVLPEKGMDKITANKPGSSCNNIMRHS